MSRLRRRDAHHLLHHSSLHRGAHPPPSRSAASASPGLPRARPSPGRALPRPVPCLRSCRPRRCPGVRVRSVLPRRLGDLSRVPAYTLSVRCSHTGVLHRPSEHLSGHGSHGPPLALSLQFLDPTPGPVPVRPPHPLAGSLPGRSPHPTLPPPLRGPLEFLLSELSGNVTWVPVSRFASGENAGNRIPYAPRLLANLALDFQHGPLRSSLLVHHRGEQFGDETNLRDIPNDAAGGIWGGLMPAYTTLDLTAEWRTTEALSVFGALKNLTDERYITGLRQGIYVGPGRSFEVGVRQAL
ncbi:MAG: TonB-dependent receptor [Gemmatimonadales bacterium]|nr:MAG: TonB-dependent receptor [Gemmatimonadales bacterium]